jgi:hypothetical protein
MRRVTVGFVLVAAVLAAGCRTPMTAGADFDPGVLIGQPATFAWGEIDGLPIGDPRFDNNPFFNARLRGAITRELSARGIRLAEGTRKPSLLVHYHAAVQDHVEVFPTEPTATPAPYGAGTQVYQYEEGNFIVDVVEAGTGKPVWRGWARFDLMGALDEPDRMDELLGYAVDRMFGFFPIPEGTVPVYVEEEVEVEVEIE